MQGPLSFFRPPPAAAEQPRPAQQPANVADPRRRLSGAEANQRDHNNARFTLWVVTIVNMPQIIATIFVLSEHWETAVCDKALREWALGSMDRSSALNVAPYGEGVRIMMILKTQMEHVEPLLEGGGCRVLLPPTVALGE